MGDCTVRRVQAVVYGLRCVHQRYHNKSTRYATVQLNQYDSGDEAHGVTGGYMGDVWDEWAQAEPRRDPNKQLKSIHVHYPWARNSFSNSKMA